MAAGGGDLDRALGAFLTLHIAEIEPGGARGGKARLGRRQQLGPFEMVDDRQQARSGDDLDLAGPGRFATAGLRADDPALAAGGGKAGEQHPGDARHRTVERQLAKGGIGGEFIGRQRLHRHQQGEGDRQVEMAAFLQHVGRGEVDGDPLWRQGQAERLQCRAHPFAQFGDRLVRQADYGEGRQPGGDRHLGLDLDDLDAVECHGANLRGHALPAS